MKLRKSLNEITEDIAIIDSDFEDTMLFTLYMSPEFYGNMMVMVAMCHKYVTDYFLNNGSKEDYDEAAQTLQEYVDSYRVRPINEPDEAPEFLMNDERAKAILRYATLFVPYSILTIFENNDSGEIETEDPSGIKLMKKIGHQMVIHKDLFIGADERQTKLGEGTVV